MQTVVITGANRGLGLEFVRQYLEAGWNVFGTYRDLESTNPLKELALKFRERLKLFSVDVTDQAEVMHLIENVDEVDLLILNAGTTGYKDNQPLNAKPFGKVAKHQFLESLMVNTYAPRMMLSLFADKLAKRPHACAVYISTPLAFAQTNRFTGYDTYAESKAAGNVIMWEYTKSVAEDWVEAYKDNPGMIASCPGAFAVSPGFARTDMGGPKGKLSPAESVAKVMAVIAAVRQNKEYHGFYSEEGKLLQTYSKSRQLETVQACVATLAQPPLVMHQTSGVVTAVSVGGIFGGANSAAAGAVEPAQPAAGPRPV